jgi:hypothetical protein
MTNRIRSLVCSASMLAFSIACSSGPAAPTAPTALTNADSATPSSPASVVGVTVEGTVGFGNGSSAQADGVRALVNAGGARVSVVGQNVSTMTDTSGHFTLKNVTPGHTELRFEASGVDARLAVGDLTQGQNVSLDVQVLGQTATPVRSDDKGTTEVSLRGTIEAIAGSDAQVSGRRVAVDGATRVFDRQNAPTTFSALRTGDLVQVEGVARADGSVLAAKISLEGLDDRGAPSGAQVTFTGTVSMLSPLTVGGRVVATDGATKVLDRQNSIVTLAAVKVGGLVEVEGTSRSDGSVLAAKIKLEDGDDSPEAVEVSFTGTISSKSPLVVAGRTVVTDGSTSVLDRQNVAIPLSALSVGGMVEVEGVSRPDGSVLAKKIKQEDGAEAPQATEVKFVGAISGVSPLVVAGRTVVIDGSTRLLDKQNNTVALSFFKAGDRVEVEGTTRADGAVLARKIRLQD